MAAFFQKENKDMPTVTTKDGTEIFFKDWGTGEPLFFPPWLASIGRRLDTQMMFFLDKGYRVIAHDRRGHGRSTQTATETPICSPSSALRTYQATR
jgi:non-heme chloroperoxidase